MVSFFHQQRYLLSALLFFAACLLFHFYGSAVRGYIDTSSLFVWWGTIWMVSEDARHGPLLLGVAGWLFWRNLKRSPRSEDGGAPWVGLGLLALALGLHWFAFMVQQTRLSCVAFLLCLYGLCWFCGGRRWGECAIFPLGLLVLALPLEALTEDFSYYLRALVIQLSHSLSLHSGFEVIRSGTQLYSATGEYQYDVAPACSGIRSLAAMLAISLVVGYVAFRSFWRRLVVLCLAVPFAVVGNIIRVYAIILAAELIGVGAGEVVHEYFGFLIFLIVFGLSLLAVSLLDRFAPEEEVGEAANEACSTPVSVDRRYLLPAFCGVLLFVGCAGLLAIQENRREALSAGVRLAQDGMNPVRLPVELVPDWSGREMEVTMTEREILPEDTGYSRKLYRNMHGRQVFLSIVLSGQDRSSIHRPEVCLVAQGWTIKSREKVELVLGPEGDVLPVVKLRARMVLPGGQEVESLFVYWFVSSEEVVAGNVRRAWVQARDRIFRLKSHRWAYIYAQGIVSGNEAQVMEDIKGVIEQTIGMFQEVKLKKGIDFSIDHD